MEEFNAKVGELRRVKALQGVVNGRHLDVSIHLVLR
jgi:hypothetical protein